MTIAKFARPLALTASLVISTGSHLAAQNLPKLELNVVGGIGNLTMYQNKELPFWTEVVPRESGGAIKVQVKPYTELGFKGPEILRLVSQGTLQIATTSLAYNTGDMPITEAMDLVGLVSSVQELRTVINAFRDNFAREMETKHRLKVLGYGAYQAQVFYCRDAFTSLSDLKGRRVRAAGASLQAFVQSLGASPISLAFAEVQPALASGVIDCAITGTLSGYKSRWYESANYISPMPVNFGMTVYVANLPWFKGLDPRLQAFLETQSRRLENDIFEQAEQETEAGLACNTGNGPCAHGQPAKMKLVPVTPEDDKLRRDALNTAVLPAFAQRCGAQCVAMWNDTIGKTLNIAIR